MVREVRRAVRFAFVVYHLLHIYGPLHADYVSGDVHHNLLTGLRSAPVAAAYVVATVLFGLHLHHGLLSVLTTFGAQGMVARRLAPVARGFAVVVTIGFLLPCAAAFFGWR